jgi:hypothetical protein
MGDKSFAEKVFEKVTRQFTSGTAGEAHDKLVQRRNRLDEINRQLEEGDDPNKDIFEKDSTPLKDFDL